MNRLQTWWQQFVKKVEGADVAPRPDEQIEEGKAFTYRLHDLQRPFSLCSGDTINCRVTDEHGNVEVSENIDKSITVDAVAVFRFKDAFGMVNGIGGAFGMRKR